MEIFKSFRIEAAHRLPNVPAEHKCARLHGHSFVIGIYVAGPGASETGWGRDFAGLGEAMAEGLEGLDHRYLNEIAGLENPTREGLAMWGWRKLPPRLARLLRVLI